MLSGESIAINIFATVQFPPEGTILTNTVTVTSETAPDPISGNDVDIQTSEVTLQPRDADVSVSKDVKPSVSPGEFFVYDITVTNEGPDEARSVFLSDDLPIGVTFDRVSFTPQSSFKECHIVTSSGSISCNLLTMQNGESIDVSIVAIVDPNAQEGDAIVNNVEVTASPDNNILNSEDMASTIVGPDLDLTRFSIGLSCVPSTDELFLNFPVFTKGDVPLQAIIPSAITCPPDFDGEVFLSDVPDGVRTAFFGSDRGVPFSGFCDLDNIPAPPNFNISFDIDNITGDVFCEVGINSIASMNLTPAVCGDGIKAPIESCDDGNLEDGDGCDSLCQLEPFCGNGVIDGVDDCDDGNNSNNDACLNDCTVASCGDTFVRTGVEDCEPPNTETCDASCMDIPTEAQCGNGIVETDEECDDNNTEDGDGCDSQCQIESVVGGEILPIESTSLLLASAQSFSWMIPVVLSVLGIGLFVVSRKSE